MTSFTVAFWMNTEKHTGGGQSLFMMPNTSDFWGNLFVIIEGNDNPADPSMLFKSSFAVHWVEFNGNNGLNRLPDNLGGAHVRTPDTNTQLVFLLLSSNKNNTHYII